MNLAQLIDPELVQLWFALPAEERRRTPLSALRTPLRAHERAAEPPIDRKAGRPIRAKGVPLFDLIRMALADATPARPFNLSQIREMADPQATSLQIAQGVGRLHQLRELERDGAPGRYGYWLSRTGRMRLGGTA